MKFEDALNAIYDKTEAESNTATADHNVLSSDGLITASKIWNMIALAQSEKGLDDFVIIRNNNIISKPLKPVKEKPDEEIIKKPVKDGKSQKSKTANNEKLDVKEKDKKPDNKESATDSE